MTISDLSWAYVSQRDVDIVYLIYRSSQRDANDKH